jgi:hypothetical protein
VYREQLDKDSIYEFKMFEALSRQDVPRDPERCFFVPNSDWVLVGRQLDAIVLRYHKMICSGAPKLWDGNLMYELVVFM